MELQLESILEIILKVESIDAQGNATLSIDLSSIDFSSEVQPAVDAALANLVGTAPATMDTIQELADAMGNDPNFSVTLATSFSRKDQALPAVLILLEM